ncbi:two-component sensor histidine kinase, partial [Streptomyces sp. SID5785]|nr:two-component sensor histidine kinase [Streptomyces sp. SID5785]
MIDRRRLLERWRGLDVTVRDLPLGLLLLVASLLPGLRGNGTEVGGLPTRPTDLLAAAAAVLQCLPLAVRRRLPLVCLALVSAGFAVDQLRGYHLFAGTALPIALLSAGLYVERFRREATAVASVAFVALSLALHRTGSDEPV